MHLNAINQTTFHQSLFIVYVLVMLKNTQQLLSSSRREINTPHMSLLLLVTQFTILAESFLESTRLCSNVFY